MELVCVSWPPLKKKKNLKSTRRKRIAKPSPPNPRSKESPHHHQAWHVLTCVFVCVRACLCVCERNLLANMINILMYKIFSMAAGNISSGLLLPVKPTGELLHACLGTKVNFILLLVFFFAPVLSLSASLHKAKCTEPRSNAGSMLWTATKFQLRQTFQIKTIPYKVHIIKTENKVPEGPFTQMNTHTHTMLTTHIHTMLTNYKQMVENKFLCMNDCVILLAVAPKACCLICSHPKAMLSYWQSSQRIHLNGSHPKGSHLTGKYPKSMKIKIWQQRKTDIYTTDADQQVFSHTK